MGNILIKGCIVLPMTAALEDEQKLFTGNIGIASGKVVFASDSVEEYDAFLKQYGEKLTIIDGAGFVAMPGLINLHNHVSMSLMRSYADDMPLMPWLNEKIWPFESKLTAEDIALGARLGIAEMLLGGTTAFADMYWMTRYIAEEADKMGIRALIGSSFLDGRTDEFKTDIAYLAERYVKNKNTTVQIAAAPHAPYTCSPETIKEGLKMCQKYGIGVHTHISETRDEIAIIKEKYNKTPVEYFRDLGMFDYPTLAAHCVWVDEKDMEIMVRYRVSVAHNPQSNMKLASGAAPVAKMVEHGLNVGIGTDGPSSNNDLDMWDEMRTASLLQKLVNYNPCALPAYQILQMATVNGAKALGLEGKTGVIKKDAWADIILVNVAGVHLNPHNDIIANLVYCGKAADVDTVIVNGRILVRNHQLLGVDVEALCKEAGKRVEEIKRR